MRTLILLLLGCFAAVALPPDWDRKSVSPACPYCESTLGWNAQQCYSCQAKVEWALPAAPENGEEAWRFLATAVARHDRAFIKVLVEGEAEENERTLAIAPLMGFAKSSPVDGGERVVAISTDRATSLVLRWSKGKFMGQREAHRPLKNQVESIKLLKAAAAAEGKLRDGDLDGNGAADFWAGDWSGLARLADAEGNAIALIPPEAAAADLRPLPASDGVAARPRLLAAAQAAPWSGYRFTALELDESGNAFAADGPDADAKAWEGAKAFAFIAIPAERGVTGWMTLVVSEDGQVWGKDLGIATGREGASGQPSAEDSAVIAAAIRDLDADAQETREAADAKLRSFGRKAKEAIEEALKSAAPEPLRRMRDILEDLKALHDSRRWPSESKDLMDAGWERL
ncbi:MAG: hypothetical protein FD180_99 [Planctomycetota bacterium]|nr:MAG: hypothetical protein FD180_99 [Planctomycetota bacterium]